MNQFEEYIEKLVQNCLNSSTFASLPQDQREAQAEQIRDHFNNVILDTTIDNLSSEQLQQLQGLTPDNPVLTQKIEEFTSTMPTLLPEIEDKLNKNCQYIQQTGQLPKTL